MDYRSSWRCRAVNHFEKICLTGEGTFGRVYKARDKITKEMVALKKVKMEKETEGFPITAIREISLLKKLNHPNIVKLKEIVTSRSSESSGNVYMVFEYMPHDLDGLLHIRDPTVEFTIPHLKCLIAQMLEGLQYLHSQNIVHRDLKCANLLINNSGELKLADFNLARKLSTGRQIYTYNVITHWYRPPELLLGANQYGSEIDMWSAGCIIGEMLTRKPMFPDNTDAGTFRKIVHLLGSPPDGLWNRLPLYNSMAPSTKMSNVLRYEYPHLDEQALDLIKNLISYIPNERLTAGQALHHPYFYTEPLPCKPSELPVFQKDTNQQLLKKQNYAHLPAKRPRNHK